MGVRIIRDKEQGYSVMYCSTTMWAFGGVFYDDEEPDDFIDWLKDTDHKDPRELKDNELENKIYEWRRTLEVTNESK